MVYNESWIQILGKADVPSDIKVKQVAMFSHAIPYWQNYGQRLQLAREAEEAARPKPQLAIRDATFTSPAAPYLDLMDGAGTPTTRGPDGLAQLVAATGPEPATFETYAMNTPRTSPIRQSRNRRSKSAMQWRRSTSCSERRKRSTASCTTDVGAEPFGFADFAGADPESFRH